MLLPPVTMVTRDAHHSSLDAVYRRVQRWCRWWANACTVLVQRRRRWARTVSVLADPARYPLKGHHPHVCCTQVQVIPINALCPPRLKHKSQLPITAYYTKLKYKTIKASTSAHKNSFFVKTIPLWNQLPSEIAECCTIEAFKKQWKHFRD